MKNGLKEANTASAVSTQNSPSLTLTLANSTVAFFLTLTFYLIATTVYVLLYDSAIFIKYHFLTSLQSLPNYHYSDHTAQHLLA